MNKAGNILVIKLGAFGDFIQALGPMQAIRAHHPKAHITLLTTKLFKSFAEQCGYFDEIWLDTKPKWYQPTKWHALRKRFNQGQFARVYDLQNNDRTAFYLKLFSPRPEWVGAAHGASHRNISPERTAGHAFDGHVQTLALAGITNIKINTLDWLKEDISAIKPAGRYALLIPGCAPSHPEKRWPAEYYGALAQQLTDQGLTPLIIGTYAEAQQANIIKNICPQAQNLLNKTSFAQIASLAKDAAIAIGNDTGPMHLIGAAGCPSLVLFSHSSNPNRHAPKGACIDILQKPDLNDLSVDDVFIKAKTLIRD